MTSQNGETGAAPSATPASASGNRSNNDNGESSRDSTARLSDSRGEPAAHISGTHLAALLGVQQPARLSDLVGSERADIIVGWYRTAVLHGEPVREWFTGRITADPYCDEVYAVPVEFVEERLGKAGAPLPTRDDVLQFARADLADGGDGIDPDDELLRAKYVADPDLPTTSAREERVCGVPRSIYDTLDPQDQARVKEGRVIASPRAPTAVARWLIRQRFSRRATVPGRNNRRHRVPARTLIRIDQTYYAWEGAGSGPARWVAHPDPEWMRARLRELLADRWYVHTRRNNGADEYSLKWWSPNSQVLREADEALADLVRAEGGTTSRELPDLYGRRSGLYGSSHRVLVRNGVLDVATGGLMPSTPLWFSPTMIAADYDASADASGTEWMAALRAQWPDDPSAITCLQQWFGYALSGRTDLQKWMLIFGPSGSGKSIIAGVLQAMMGAATATKLDTLNSQFGLADLYTEGASLALLSDIRFSARDSSTAVGNLLAITGEDDVVVERKYKTSVTARLGVRFHGSANELPRLQDNANALARRMLLLETSTSFRGTERDDPGLRRRIVEHELGAVLRWALDGLQLLDASDGKFARSERADELDQQMGELASPVRTFVNECVEIGSDADWVDLHDLFRVYRAWAEANNTGARMSQTKFRAALGALYLDPIKNGQKRSEGRKLWVVWGVQRAEVRSASREFGGIEVVVTIDSTAASALGGASMN